MKGAARPVLLLHEETQSFGNSAHFPGDFRIVSRVALKSDASTAKVFRIADNRAILRTLLANVPTVIERLPHRLLS